MKENKLNGKRVAILVAEGFEQVELTAPQEALEGAGAETKIVSLKSGTIKGWQHTDWGDEFQVDLVVEKTSAEDFDALLLPGGVMNPDKLRMSPKAVAFVKAFVESGKPVAAICHGPWMLAEADVVDGRRLTSYPSIKTDLENAGADWVNETVVVDQGLVTSRQPADIPAFNRKMIEEFAEGKHQDRARSMFRKKNLVASGVD